MMNKIIYCGGSIIWGFIRIVFVFLFFYRKYGYLVLFWYDVMKSFFYCGLFLYKYLNILVLKSYIVNFKRFYLFLN